MAKRITPKHAVVYLRVSTQKQADEGVSLEAQDSLCRAHAARMGIDVVAVCRDEGISGREGIDGRPGLAEAIRIVRSTPGTIVVVYSVSRLARRQRLLWEIIDEKGLNVPMSSATEAFDTSTASGRAMLGMLSTFAALESDMISQRTRDAMAHLKSQGRTFGAKPMHELVGDAVALARELYATGNYSHRSLADELNQRGIKSARGRAWHATSVRTAVS